MQNQPRRRLSLPTHALFVVCQYMGACAVCLGYPGTGDAARLWPHGPEVHRYAMMLWPLLLLTADVLLDRAWLKALRADLAEGEGLGRGLHRKTLEALSAMALFVLDIVAILAVLSCQRENAAGEAGIRLHTAAMAAGIILWIYGRLMPRIPFNSVWGIRTPAATKDIQAWGAIHLKAMPVVCVCGAVCLVAGTFLSPIAALCCAAVCLFAAFAFMFTRR